MAQARATTRKRATTSVRALMRRFGISARVGVGFGLVGVMLACVVAGFVAWRASLGRVGVWVRVLSAWCGGSCWVF